jgi:hypothetical protein
MLWLDSPWSVGLRFGGHKRWPATGRRRAAAVRRKKLDLELPVINRHGICT